MGARFDFPFLCSLRETRFSCLQMPQPTFANFTVIDSTNRSANQDKRNRIRSTAHRPAAAPRTHL